MNAEHAEEKKLQQSDRARNNIVASGVLPLVLTFALLAFLAPLGVYALTGFSARYWADDYCYSTVLQDFGFWQSQVVFYQTTSGRFLGILLIGVSELLGPGAIRWWAALNFLVLFSGFAWLLAGLGRRVGIAWPKLGAAFAAAVLLFFLVYLAPNRLQVFYWRTGIITYSLPLGLLAIHLAGMQRLWEREKPPVCGLGLIALLACLAGGASETFGAMQTALLGLLILLALAVLRGGERRQALILLGAALAGSLVALGILFVSPSNALRQVHFPPPPDLFTLIRMSLWHALDFALSSLRAQPLPNLVLLAAGGTVGLLLPLKAGWRQRALALALIPLAAYILLLAVMAPSAYAQSASPEARALIVARFVTVVAVFSWGLAAAWLGRDRVLSTLSPQSPPPGGARPAILENRLAVLALVGLSILIVLSIYPLRAVRMEWPAVAGARQWAEHWDTRDAFLRAEAAAGRRVVDTVELDSRSGLLEVGPDPHNWLNACAATYYDLDVLRATP